MVLTWSDFEKTGAARFRKAEREVARFESNQAGEESKRCILHPLRDAPQNVATDGVDPLKVVYHDQRGARLCDEANEELRRAFGESSGRRFRRRALAEGAGQRGRDQAREGAEQRG